MYHLSRYLPQYMKYSTFFSLFLIHHSLYWGWLGWDSHYLAVSTFITLQYRHLILLSMNYFESSVIVIVALLNVHVNENNLNQVDRLSVSQERDHILFTEVNFSIIFYINNWNFTLKMKALRPFETPVTIYPIPQFSFPETTKSAFYPTNSYVALDYLVCQGCRRSCRMCTALLLSLRTFSKNISIMWGCW